MQDNSKSQRNGGQWTEGRYEGFIKNVLRGAMRKWPPKWAAINAASMGPQKNPRTGRRATFFRCAECNKGYPRTSVQVDHIVPIGTTKTWDEYIERLFCEIDNLQVLCKKCHKKKTKLDNHQNRKRQQRRVRSNSSSDS